MKKLWISGMLLAVTVFALLTGAPKEAAAAETSTETSDSAQVKAGWIEEDGHYYYQQSDGTILQETGMVQIGKYWYYLSKKHWRMTGFRESDGLRYYFKPSNGRRYETTGWKTIKKKKYYFLKTAAVATGVKKIGKKRYAFNSKGVLRGFTKPFKYNGNWYRSDKNGVAEKLTNLQVKVSELTWKFIDAYSSKKASKAVRFRKCFNKMEGGRYVPGCIPRSATRQKNFQYKIAFNVLTHNYRHNCYGFACMIASIAKELGYEPYVIVMTDDHAVVQINGKYYDNMGARFGASSPALKGFKVYKKVKF